MGFGLLTIITVAIIAKRLQKDDFVENVPNRDIKDCKERFLAAPVWIYVAPLCLNFCFIYWSVAGLDTVITVFVYTFATYLLYRYLHGGVSLLCGIVVGLAVWARPEGMAFVFFAILAALAIGGRGPRFRRFLLGAAIPIVTLLVLRWAIYGDLLQIHIMQSVEQALQTSSSHFPFVAFDLSLGHAPSVAFRLFRGGRVDSAAQDGGSLSVMVPVATVACLILQSGGDWMPFLRFVVPAFPILSLFTGAGILACWHWLDQKPMAWAGTGLVLHFSLPARWARRVNGRIRIYPPTKAVC